MPAKRRDKPKGDTAMRARGKKKVSFWITEEEERMVCRAMRFDLGFIGAAARRIFLDWARHQVAERDVALGGAPPTGGTPLD